MKNNIVTDGLAVMALAVAAVAAAFLFTDTPRSEENALHYQTSWAESSGSEEPSLPAKGG